MSRLRLSLVLFMLLGLAAWPTGAQAAVIDATVGPGFTVTMGPVPGPGAHTVRVLDQSASHNFSLRAPDGSVVAATTVAQTGTFEFVVQFVQGTYTFLCDPHAGSMNGSVVVPPPPPPPPPPAPINVDPPMVTGSSAVGELLACSTGSWSNSPTGFAFQWRRDGVSLPGATTATYTVAAADAGSALVCRVTASNAGGASSADAAARPIPAPIRIVAPPSSCSSGVAFKHLASSVHFSWTASLDARSYEVSISRGGSTDYDVVDAATTADQLQVAVSTGASYELRVRARADDGTFSAYCRASAVVPAANVRFGTGAGGLLLGWVGDDELLGGDANDQIFGFTGSDRLLGGVGDDQINGGPDRDSLAGNAGNDVLIAGRDADTVGAGPGDDRINARDGAAHDVVQCGTGTDRVLADVGDRIAGDCERVLRSPLARAAASRVVVAHHGAHHG